MNATATPRRTQPRDKHLAAIKAGLSTRCLAASGVPPSRTGPDNPETARFAAMPLPEIAKQCLMADGYSRDDLDAMSPADRAMLAFGGGPRASGRAGVMTTGSLREVTRDAVNKSLTAGYEEAPQTWRGPMRQAPSVSDFKDIHRIKLGSPDSLPIWPDNTVPRETRLADEAESYALEARAEGLSFSWRLFINDDLDALSRRPAMLGAAAARTVNQSAWAELTNRARKLADGQGLFVEAPTGLRHRSNLTTGAGQPSNATLGAMRAKMRQMRGLNADGGGESDALLNLTPTYLACGTELEELVLKQVLSGADPASGGNSAVYNTASTLTPVIEPLLDLDSATAFYLFASPNRVDTIEVTFLTGQETPITHEWMDDSTMSQHFTIIQTFAARAIDYRGIQRHDGV